MDLTVSTKIGLGMASEGRTHIGRALMTIHSDGSLNPIVHTTMRCRSTRATGTFQSVTLFEEGGVLKAMYRSEWRSVEYCKSCPPQIDYDWQLEALCRGSDEDFFTLDEDRQDILISVYCTNCPVQSECFEAEVSHPEREGGIWGGLFLGTKGREKKEKDIEAHRARIEARIS